MCIAPTLTKCCFFFPLRKGVLCYGYIHLILCVLGSVYLVGCPSHRLPKPMPEISAGLLILDALFLIILLIACHQNNIRLLKTPFLYNKVCWVLLMMLTCFIAARLVFIYNEEPNMGRAIALYAGSIILSSLVCVICIRSYIILWIKGLMTELKKQSPSFDITTETHILEVDKNLYEEIHVQIEDVEDEDNNLHTENKIEVHINKEKVKTQADGIGDKLNAANKNDQDIELQVLN